MPIPKPTKGEDKNTFISRCMGNGVMKKEFPDQKQRSAVCYDSWKEEVKPMIVENKKIVYTQPIEIIEEKLEEGNHSNKIKIKGTMIKASTTRNGITYKMDELATATFNKKSMEDVKNLPFSMDHTDSVKDIVGSFRPIMTNEGLDFEASIINTPYHPGAVSMFRNGLLGYVSIEALAKTMVKEDDNIVAKGLDFTGLAAVKSPGCTEATFAIAEAFKNDPEVETMAENEKTEPQEEPKEEPQEEKESVSKEILESIKSLKEDVDSYKKENEALKKQLDEMKEKQTKGVVTEESKPSYEFELVENKSTGGKEYYAKDSKDREGNFLY